MSAHRALCGLVALAVAGALSGCAPPEPRLEVVAAEPALEAPVPAVELGRVENDSEAPLIMQISVSARVFVAYEVNLPPEEALAAWVDAYDDRYAFRDITLRYPEVRGGTDEVSVTVAASEQVELAPPERESFDEPTPGATVVTVLVSGRD